MAAIARGTVRAGGGKGGRRHHGGGTAAPTRTQNQAAPDSPCRRPRRPPHAPACRHDACTGGVGWVGGERDGAVATPKNWTQFRFAPSPHCFALDAAPTPPTPAPRPPGCVCAVGVVKGGRERGGVAKGGAFLELDFGAPTSREKKSSSTPFFVPAPSPPHLPRPCGPAPAGRAVVGRLAPHRRAPHP